MSSPPNSRQSASRTTYHTLSLDFDAFAASQHEITSAPPSTVSSCSMHNHALSLGSISASSTSRQRPDIRNFALFSAAHSSSLPQQPLPPATSMRMGRKVVAIKRVPGTNSSQEIMSKDNFYQDKFLSGDIVQSVAYSDDVYFISPFPSGKSGLMKELHNFYRRSCERILTIQVNRCERHICRTVRIVRGRKHNYVLQDFHDTNHLFTLEDDTLERCATIQAQGLREAQQHLSKLRVAAIDADYPWEKAMKSENGFGMLYYSMLVVPQVHADVHMENTARQALTWLHESDKSGIPLLFQGIQTEPLISEALEQSLSVDISRAVSCRTYSLDLSQCDGERFVVVRAIRIWFAFCAAEIEVSLEAMQGENVLGINLARTVEGFCYVTEVVPDTAASRAGLTERLDAATRAELKLVVTKVGNERVLPWLISRGSIRCYDVNSISRKLSAFRRAGKPACLHILDIALPSVPQAPESTTTSLFSMDEHASSTSRNLCEMGRRPVRLPDSFYHQQVLTI